MAKSLLIFIVVGFLLISAVSASAMTVRAIAEPSLDNITVSANSFIRISILMNNDDGFVRGGMQMLLTFYSPDQSITNVTHYSIPGGDGPSHSVQFLNGFDSWFEEVCELYGMNWDGIDADTVVLTTCCVPGMPSGLGEQKYISFYYKIDQEGIFCIDSCDIYTQEFHTDWAFEPPIPPFNGPYCWNIEFIDDYICGDANHDGNINLLDVTYLIKYLYGGGLMPYPFEAGDVNSSDSIEILDVAFMVNYLYKGGPGLNCIQ